MTVAVAAAKAAAVAEVVDAAAVEVAVVAAAVVALCSFSGLWSVGQQLGAEAGVVELE